VNYAIQNDARKSVRQDEVLRRPESKAKTRPEDKTEDKPED